MIPDGSDQEIVIGDGIEKFITLSQVSNTEVKIELKDFELFINQQILKFGDIVIDKCEVKKGKVCLHSPDSKILHLKEMLPLWVLVL